MYYWQLQQLRGKTEAAFFPILTELYEDPSKSVGVLYISPLKALINDQYERLSDLAKRLTFQFGAGMVR